jgi:hypothetical protein
VAERQPAPGTPGMRLRFAVRRPEPIGTPGTRQACASSRAALGPASSIGRQERSFRSVGRPLPTDQSGISLNFPTPFEGKEEEENNSSSENQGKEHIDPALERQEPVQPVLGITM